MLNTLKTWFEPIVSRLPKRFRQFGTLSSLRIVDIGTGILKDIIITKSFGLGLFLDAYFVVISYLDMVSGYFQQMGYGVLVPRYNDDEEDDSENNTRAKEIMSDIQSQHVVAFMNYICLSMVFLAVFVVSFYTWLGPLIAPGLAEEGEEYLNMLLLVTLPISMLFQGSYSLRLLLVQQERFGWFHWPGIISTLFFCLLVWVFNPSMGYKSVIWAMPASQILQFLLYWFALKLKWQPVWKAPYIGKMLKDSAPNILITIFFYLFVPVDNYFLAGLPEGQLSAFRYAGKIITVLGTLSVYSLQITMVPKLMKAGSQKDIPEMTRIIKKGLRETLVFSIPVMVVMWLVAPLFIRVLFERGAFDASDTNQVADIIRILVYQLPYLGGWMLVSRSLNSLYLLKPFVYLGLFGVLSRVLVDSIASQQHSVDWLAYGILGHYYMMLFVGLALVFVLFKQQPTQTKKAET